MNTDGNVRAGTKEADGQIFISAPILGMFFTGTWTKTRVAAGDYVMRKTATDQAGQAVFDLSSLLLMKVGTDPKPSNMARDIRGFMLKSIDVVYGIGTTALDAHTYDIHQVVHANNVANAVTSTFGGTLSGTLATATQSNPYVTRITLGTPAVIGGNTAARGVLLEISWDAAAGSVLDYYGIYCNVDYNLL